MQINTTRGKQFLRDHIWIIFLLFDLGLFFGDAQLSKPTIGRNQLIYACTNKEVIAFQGDGTISWRVGMNQTCQTSVAPVIDYDGRVYVAADQTVVVVNVPSSPPGNPSAADFFGMVPSISLEAIGNFSSVTGLAVTSWSSVLYINTGTGIHAFMFDGTPLWSTFVQFNDSAMNLPKSMGPCVHNMTNCYLLPELAVDECDGSVYVARTDGLLFSYATWQPFLRWTYALSDDIPLSVTIVAGSNGRVYAAVAKHDMIYAFSTEIGTLLWQVEVGPLSEESCAPRVDVLGFVSVGSLDGFVYVISPDGHSVSKYLAANNLSLVSILVAPVIDCSNKALFVAQTRVSSKTITQQMDGTKALGLTQFLGMNVYMFVPSSGQVLWSTLYPDISRNSLCQSSEAQYKITCAEIFFTITKAQTPGNSRALIGISISILVIFFVLSLLTLLVYCCWRKKQIVHRRRLYQLLKQERFRHPQGLLLSRQRVYERNIEYLQAELEAQPKSTKIVDQLRVAFEGLHFIERYLAMFQSDALQGDHLHQEQLLVEDKIAASAVARASTKGGLWSGLMDFFSVIFFGAPEEEDFTEELQTLSEYNNCPPPSAILVRRTSKRRRLGCRSASQQFAEISPACSDSLTTEDPNTVCHEALAEEYSNPLYNASPTPSSAKKSVSFSLVNEVFEDRESMPITMPDDNDVRLEESLGYDDVIVSQEEDPESDHIEETHSDDYDVRLEESSEYDDFIVSQEKDPASDHIEENHSDDYVLRPEESPEYDFEVSQEGTLDQVSRSTSSTDLVGPIQSQTSFSSPETAINI